MRSRLIALTTHASILFDLFEVFCCFTFVLEVALLSEIKTVSSRQETIVHNMRQIVIV